MEIIEYEIHLLAKMEKSVQTHYHDCTDLAHGFEHVQRVYHLALHLAEQEQAEWGLQLCCMMCDVRLTALHAHMQHAQ